MPPSTKRTAAADLAPKATPINPRIAHALGEYTRRYTACELWAELLTACRDGGGAFKMSLKTSCPEHVALGIALESQGCTVEWLS